MYKVLVCGGRTFGAIPQGPIGRDETHPDHDKRVAEYFFVKKILHNLCVEKGFYKEDIVLGADYYEGITIIHGGAKGADRCADDWAIVNFVPFEEYPANWEEYGKSAGYRRNKQMLDEGKPNLVIAFPGGKGTANMVKLAKEANIEVREITYTMENISGDCGSTGITTGDTGSEI